MKQFFQITRFEFLMSIRRPGFWIAYSLLGLFYIATNIIPNGQGSGEMILSERVWEESGLIVFMFNIFMPILAGILTADRMQRDFQVGIQELQQSTPLARISYVLSKYFGSLAAVLLPVLMVVLAVGVEMIAFGFASPKILVSLLAAFVTISVPAHAFVVAFSIACPLIIPLRVYQVLFTGYWFWGNLLSPKAFPTISDTLLNAVGQYPLQAYFGAFTDPVQPGTNTYTPLMAVFNLVVLVACSAIALTFNVLYLRKQAQKA